MLLISLSISFSFFFLSFTAWFLPTDIYKSHSSKRIGPLSHWVSKSELKSAGLKRENDPCHCENKSERSTVLKADPFISLSFSSEWFVRGFFLVSGAWLPRATEWFICSHLSLWAETRNQARCFSHRARAAIQLDIFVQMQRQQWSHNWWHVVWCIHCDG